MMHRDIRPLRTGVPFFIASCALFAPACGSESEPSTEAWSTVSQPLEAQPKAFIVLLERGRSPAAFASAQGLTAKSLFTTAIQGLEVEVSAAAAAGLRRAPGVVSVTEVLPRSAFAQQASTGLMRIGGSSPADVSGIGVAVVDTGIVSGNSDLNVVGRVDCSSRLKKDKTCVVGGVDGHGHGSHVAGIIGANDDDQGVVGVVPGVSLYSVKVLDNGGSGTTATIIKGLDWAAANADVIDVVNMSLGGACTSGAFLVACDTASCATTTDPEHAAICGLVEAGITVVVAAGNSAADSKYYAPAAYPEVITVSALADFDGLPGGLSSATASFSSCTEAEDDSLACFSNYGAAVDIAAPGVGILSWTTQGLESWSGTSMASPFVAGAAAAVLANSPGLSPAQVKAALMSDAVSGYCATPSGACTDDPDGLSEPLVQVGAGCQSDAECDDGNACTQDSCTLGACGHALTSCDDGNACTQDACNPDTGGCENNVLDCNDGDACNGAETCEPSLGCQSGTAVVCDDGDACTEDVCDPATGSCGMGADLCAVCASNGQACSVGADCCSGNCKRGSCKGN